MENIFQRYLYIFSSILLIAIMFSTVWFLQNKTIIVPIICVLLFIVIDIWFLLSFYYARKWRLVYWNH